MSDAPQGSDASATPVAQPRTAVSNRIDFSASLDSFQGPLDLLLYLIKENEVEITDIPIALILEQYLRFLDAAPQWDLQLAGEFLVMAATLMEIKSRELLPVQEQPTDAEEIIEDPRSELVRQLLQYRQLKDQAKSLEKLQDEWQVQRPRGFFGDGGKTWEERDHGADISCITDIRFFDGKTYATVMDEGLLESDDNGATWKQLFPLKYTGGVSGHHWRVFPSKSADGATHIVSASSAWDAPVNNVIVSTDGGKTFTVHAEGLPKTRPKKNTMWGDGYARALAADPKNPQILYLGIDGDPDEQHPTGGGVFKSTDGGVTWKQLAHQPGSRRMFYGLAVDPTDSQRLFWGACAEGGGLYRSEDGGDSWTHVFQDEKWIFNMTVAPNGDVYCGGSNLWRSTDHGTTWKKISDFKDGCTIIGLEPHPKDDKTLWISRVTWGEAAVGGIFKTTDGGATWQEITGDIPCRKPLVLRFNPDTSELWAGNVGLFKLKQ